MSESPDTELPPDPHASAGEVTPARTEPVPASSADDDLDALLDRASFEDPVLPSTPARSPSGRAAEPRQPQMPQFEKVLQEAQVSGIDLLRDVDLEVKIELGRSHMLVEDVLKLVEGSVVELDKLAGDPVDVYVNDRLVARGEVLVLNDNFCVRVNEVLSTSREEDL